MNRSILTIRLAVMFTALLITGILNISAMFYTPQNKALVDQPTINVVTSSYTLHDPIDMMVNSIQNGELLDPALFSVMGVGASVVIVAMVGIAVKRRG